jgi:hypothetical protein
MPKEETKELLKFLSLFPSEIVERALWLRDFVWNLYPQANELIYDNYNAVAFGWSPTEKLGHTFCSIAIGRSSGNLHFGFYWAQSYQIQKKSYWETATSIGISLFGILLNFQWSISPKC